MNHNRSETNAEILNREASRHRQAGAPQVKFDDSKMNSSYANVCNISFTREEVLLLFGMSDAWQSSQQEVNIQLTQRIILSPFAAKRMHVLLGQILRSYEQKFSSLSTAIPAMAPVAMPAQDRTLPQSAPTAGPTSAAIPRPAARPSPSPTAATGANGSSGSLRPPQASAPSTPSTADRSPR